MSRDYAAEPLDRHPVTSVASLTRPVATGGHGHGRVLPVVTRWPAGRLRQATLFPLLPHSADMASAQHGTKLPPFVRFPSYTQPLASLARTVT